MSAQMVEMRHSSGEDAFHCPLTGARIFHELDHTFEKCISPYLLFFISREGRVYGRIDELPKAHRQALERFDDALMTGGGPSGPICNIELPVFIPNVCRELFPDTVIIFELVDRRDQGSWTARNFVAMDFSLPGVSVPADSIDEISSVLMSE